jgi:hypothetical protein
MPGQGTIKAKIPLNPPFSKREVVSLLPLDKGGWEGFKNTLSNR